MKLSTRVRYGLRAMVELALHPRENPVLTQHISEKQRISKKYLENLLVALKSSGLVRSVRGSRGGYVLARSPEQITVAEIIQAFGERMEISDCVETPSVCSRVDICPTYDLWREIAGLIRSYTSGITLAELADKARAKRETLSNMYYI